ncbi:metallophosphoesterase [Clostridium thermopalmarium]|uniref:metallophosphoesterase n=1 Tax=Clostridium thermopalmarium TaxID=29373 RepID=UPI001FA94198|nr:metallophosphoesterase [Clostridium thermopalmarium]
MFFIIIICICTWVFLHFENNFITITKITVKSPKLPDAFDGCKIVHLSDLHSKEFGKGQKNLVKKIEDAQPDLIVFTGDLIDSRHFDAEVSLELIRQIVKIAPTYFVTGNHERWSGNFDALEKVLKENGIHVLRNTCDRIGKDKDGIYITGIDDPVSTQAIYEETKVVENEIKQALKEIKENDVFKILLAHRPEMLPLYSEYGFDLVLSGHAHGGQVRLPFIGGLIAPNQGFFPEYTSGEYKRGNCTMIVSRGLGNSIIFQRLFNHPEIVVLTLSKGK